MEIHTGVWLMKTQFATGAKLFAAAIFISASAVAQTTPSFNKDIAPLFNRNCVTCHRPGEIAPMSLMTYEQTRPWAKSIKAKVAAGQMPPWHSTEPKGTFLNDRRMTDEEKNLIARWVDAGAPQGDAKDLPPAPKFDANWEIGKPDLVLSMAKPYTVQAKGTIDYQYFQIPSTFTEDRWIQKIEVRPGTPSVVHHILMYAKDTLHPNRVEDAYKQLVPAPRNPQRKLTPEQIEQMQKRDPGVLIGMTAPGTNAMIFSPGVSMKIPAGATLTFQIHYTANGKTEVTDQSSVGIVFAKQTPVKELHNTAFLNPTFTLPAGAPDTAVPSAIEFTEDSHLTALVPHTHVRGKSWDYKLVFPDGRAQQILTVPNYDFNWQTLYVYANPIAVPKGTRLETIAHYDNSVNNKSNPDATKDVRWGEQTWEEMQYTGIQYTVDGAKIPTGTSSGGGQ